MQVLDNPNKGPEHKEFLIAMHVGLTLPLEKKQIHIDRIGQNSRICEESVFTKRKMDLCHTRIINNIKQNQVQFKIN